MPANALSPREMELLVLAMQCLRGGEPKLDYAKFAAAAGLANAKGGMDAWCRIRKKLGLAGRRDDEGEPAGSPRKRRTKSEGGSPKKKTREEEIKKEEVKAEVEIKEEVEKLEGI